MRKHHNGMSHLSSDMKKIRHDLALTTQELKDLVGSKYADSIQHMKDRSSEVKDHVTDYAAEKPFTALGLAALAGFFIGFFMHK